MAWLQPQHLFPQADYHKHVYKQQQTWKSLLKQWRSQSCNTNLHLNPPLLQPYKTCLGGREWRQNQSLQKLIVATVHRLLLVCVFLLAFFFEMEKRPLEISSLKLRLLPILDKSAMALSNWTYKTTWVENEEPLQVPVSILHHPHSKSNFLLPPNFSHDMSGCFTPSQARTCCSWPP